MYDLVCMILDGQLYVRTQNVALSQNNLQMGSSVSYNKAHWSSIACHSMLLYHRRFHAEGEAFVKKQLILRTVSTCMRRSLYSLGQILGPQSDDQRSSHCH